MIYKHKISATFFCFSFMTIGCITNKKKDNIKLETSPLEKVTSFNFEENFPLRDGSPQIHKHHVVMMEEPLSLERSYEPLDPNRKQWPMMVGLHFSNINPKREEGDDCPHYEEQIVFVSGGEEVDSEIFVSSQFMTRHRILSAQHYIFNKKNRNVRHWYALSDPFGDPKIEEKKSEYLSGIKTIPTNLKAKKMVNLEKNIELKLIFGQYDFERSHRSELNNVGIAIGILHKNGEKFLVKAFGDNANWNLSCYSYDRRYSDSKFEYAYKLINSKGGWVLEG